MTQGFSASHPAYDWGVVIGTPLRAMQSGVVQRVLESAKGYGLHMLLDHDHHYQTLYAHLSQALLAEGAPVKAGEIIALSGNSGNSTGPHVHVEARYQGVAFDFYPLLAALETAPSTVEQPPLMIPAFPKLPRLVVHASGLRLRAEPHTNSAILGTAPKGIPIPVIAVIEREGDLWCHVGLGQYFALRWRGELYGKFEQEECNDNIKRTTG